MKRLARLAMLLPLGCGEPGGPLSATGTDGAIDPYLCEAGATPDGEDVNPDEPGQVEGQNGLLMDRCDGEGNLVEAVCETNTECGDGPNPDCETTRTGDVGEMTFDCSGRCQNASCPSRCPAEGDDLTYLAVGDPARILNYSDGREYLCTLVFDQASDDYDCTLDPMPQDTTRVFGLGLFGSLCTGGNFGNLQTTEGCSYTCDIPPA